MKQIPFVTLLPTQRSLSPKVHDVRWEDDKLTAIVMDYMPGKPLDEIWDTLDPTQKLSIAKELHDYISQLRGLKGDYIGAVDR